MTRWGVARAWWAQSRRKFRSREALEDYQFERLRALIPFVRRHSPFYRERLPDDTPTAVGRMTPIDKSLMMAHFDRINTCGVSRDGAMRVAIQAEESRDFKATVSGLTVGLSSGTSGSRGLFLVSDTEREAWAGAILAKVLPDTVLGWHAHRIAFFLRANSNLYGTLDSRRIRFEYFDLIQPIEGQLARLADLQPTILVAPPAVLVELAHLVLAGRCPIRPPRVVSVADVLSPEDEVQIRWTFRTTVHQVYQATEGLLATTCSFGTLHLAEDLIRFDRERLDKTGRCFLPIVTDLFRTTQPVIRYRLDDVLVEREYPCPCGSVLTALERIDGRADDVLLAGVGESNGSVVLADFVRRAVLLASDWTRDFHVRQDATGDLEVWLDVSPPTAAGGHAVSAVGADEVRVRVAEALRRLFVRSDGSDGPRVRFVERPPVQPGAKRRRVERDPRLARLRRAEPWPGGTR